LISTNTASSTKRSATGSTDGDTVVFNSDGDLLPDHEAGLRQLMRQGIFVNLFKEAGAERIGDGESASNDTLGNLLETLAIGVHRRLRFFLAWGSYRWRTGSEESQPPMNADGARVHAGTAWRAFRGATVLLFRVRP
jgi:hypothetical protein